MSHDMHGRGVYRALGVAAWIGLAAAATGCGTFARDLPPRATAPPPTVVAGAESILPSAVKGRKRKARRGTPKETRFERDLRELTARAAAEPGQALWPCRIASLHLERNSVAAAETALSVALARDSTHVPSLVLLSGILYARGRHEEAIGRLEGACPGDVSKAESGPVCLALALHHDALGQTARARAVWTGQNADRSAAGTAGTYLLLRGARPGDATPWAEADAKAHPRNAASQNNLGIVRLRAGQTDPARTAFLEAIALDPARPGPYYNLAILEKYYRMDDAAAARWFAEYRKRSKADPDGLAEVFDPRPAGTMADTGDKP